MIEKSKIKNQKSKLQCKIRKGFIFWFVILIFAFCILDSNGYAGLVSSTELIENAKDYDGKAVAYQGEAIGDIMRRGGFAWVNIQDGANAIGIWIPFSLARAITFIGGYKATGDIIEVKGIFHRACPEHGGDLDIHADSLTIVKPGGERSEPFHSRRRNITFWLIGVSICLLILRLLRRR
jgi:hypothetical protein